jgi:tRNA-splicing ligase RtcB
VCATPDVHPGDGGIAIGSVVQTAGQLIPQAVGSDINCGMRMHVADIAVEQLLARRDALVTALQGDFFLGTRDVAQTAAAQRAMFAEGLPAWLRAVRAGPLGCMAAADLAQVDQERGRVHLGGQLRGDLTWAPPKLVPDEGLVRDPGMATVGGGNHFVELQVVEAVLDRHRAWEMGVRVGQISIMIHSGSRTVGRWIGEQWRRAAKDAWPKGLAHPSSGLYPLSMAHTPDLIDEYLRAEATAAHYGFVNRLLLAEIVRGRLRALFGDVEMPLVYDVPHNITLPAGDGWITRKGACPAEPNQPVIIPGSMGTASYLLVGCGHPRWLSSASHGAGRMRRRGQMHGRAEADLGLAGVDCIARRPERRVEEAPAAYKPIQPVIDAQIAAGVVQPVARMRPLLTFKA